jgi:tetratricopeptide (TPR) repeat protein
MMARIVAALPFRQLAFAFILFSAPAGPILAAPQTQQTQAPDIQTLLRQGRDYLRTRQFNEAIEVSRRIIQIKPDLSEAHTVLASALLGAGQRDEALAETKRAIELDPNDAHAYVELGLIESALRRYPEAIKAYQQALTLNPSYGAAMINLGIVYGTINRFEESAETFQQALKLEPNNVSALNGLGIAQFRLGQHDEGIENVKRAVRVNPRFADGWINLARWYVDLRRYDEAANAFTAVAQIVPKWPQVYFERSTVYLYLGKSETAAADARTVLDLTDWHSDRAEYMVIIAAIGYRQAGKADEANQVLELAAKRSNTAAWPYPVISYLRGDLTAEALLRAAGNNNDRLTEVHGYLGVDLLLKEQKEAALQQLRWVREHGNKRFVEYTLATIELDRMESAEPVKQ